MSARFLYNGFFSPQVQWEIGRPELREKVESAVLELSSTCPSGWSFMKAFVDKMDQYIATLEKQQQ